MPTIVLSSSNTAVTGFNMRFFDSGDIINLVSSYLGDNSTTELFYGNGISAELTVFGTFGNFNVDGDPTTGTANAFIYTHDIFGAFQSISVSGLSIDVPSLFDWIFTGQSIPLHNVIFNGSDTITGTAGADIILGYDGGDTLNGGEGNDEIYGEVDSFSVYTPVGGNDTLNGGGGADTLDGGNGNDIMNGGEGADIIIASSGVDTIDGGNGVDSLTFNRSNTAGGFSLNLNTLLANGLFHDGTTVQNVENFTILAGTGADTFTITADIGGAFIINAGGGVDHLVVDFSAQSGAIVFDTFVGGTIDTGAGTVVYSNFDRLTATGGSGNDSFLGSVNDDTISGGNGNDTLYGALGADTINGGDGEDYIDGGEGSDTINAGAGNDTIAFNTGGADQIDGGDGIDTVSMNLSSLSVGVTLSPATMGSPTGVTLSNGAVIRNVEGLGNTILTNFNDTMIVNGTGLIGSSYLGGSGFDIFSADFSTYSTSIVFDKTIAHPIFTLSGHVPSVLADVREFEQFLITGGSAADFLEGGSGDDTLNGGGGNDTLEAHGGTNTLNGGDGDDLIISGLDQFDSGLNPTDTIDGGAGADTLRLNLNSFSQAFTFNMAALASNGGQTLANGANVRNVERFQVDGGTGDDTFLISGPLLSGTGGQSYFNGNGGNDTAIADFSALNTAISLSFGTLSMAGGGSLSVSADVFTVTGSSVADNLTGTFGVETLNGGGGGDVLNGGAGAGDILNGGEGNDTLYSNTDGFDFNEIIDGGNGIDTAFVNHNGATGNNTIQASAIATNTGVTLADGTIVRNIETFSLVTGAGNDTLIIDSSFTGEGHFFAGGNDGDDRVVVNLADWSGALLMNNGFELQTSAFAITFAVDRVQITAGSGDDELVGGLGADTFAGNGGADHILGGGGADTLNGGEGADTLNGGEGADTMVGGNGDDTYYVDNASDITTEVSALGGTDIVFSFVSRTLTANIENLTLLLSAVTGNGNVLNNTITGNDEANALYGFDGNDILNGGLGADQMFGGNGDDTYYVDNAGDTTTEASALGGTDIVYSSVARNLTANIENLTLTGGASISGSGNALNNIITGNAAANTLYGFDGNDRLDGAGGADTLFGANGDDVYVVDNVNDITVEGSALGGIDTVETWISRNLNANFENMTLLGSATIAYGNILANTLLGNGLANSLYGFEGNDILNGGAGADQMFGADGNDTYYVDNAGDATTEVSALGGTDTVISSVERNLTANLENLILTGSATINGAGNGLNNVITGNDGVNTLFGLGGDDTLDGGLGADTLQGGANADTYAFSTALGGGNVDAIIGFNVADDTILLNNAVFTGLSAGALAASAFVIGAAAADADDRIIYNSATGQLFFDADGSDAGAAILFATLSAGLSLTSADFIIGGP